MLQLLEDVQKFIQGGGWLAVLLLVLASGYWGWWYFGPIVRQWLKDKDKQIEGKELEVIFWRTRYLNVRDTARRGVTAGKQILESAGMKDEIS